jgi:predicted permease
MADWITGRMTLLRYHSGYVVFATATLATAIGMNLVVFTIINALWLRPLPFPQADCLVTITSHLFVTLEAPALKVFEAVAGQAVIDDQAFGRLQVSLDPVGRELETVGVTPEYFRLLGLACRGRDFTPDDNRMGAEPVAIISDRLWSHELRRQDSVIGTVIGARPFPFRIIGVAPPGFEGARRGEKVDVWIPSNLVPRAMPAGASTGGVLLLIFARPPTGQTQADITRRVRQTFAGDRHYSYFAVAPLRDVFGTPASLSIVIREGRALGVVAALAMLVLIGGCATLAALVLVHYERRRQELAVRLVLGCSRRRLVGQLSSELGILAGAGTVAAVLIAFCGLRVIPSLSLPGGVDLGRLDLSIDWRVLAAAVIAAVLTLVSAAWLPITRFTRTSLAGELVAGPGATPTVSSHRTRQALLALHVCVTIVVLVAAGLFVRAVLRASWIGPGFDTGHTLFVEMRVMPQPPSLEMIEAWRQNATERTTRVMDALRHIPGVGYVAYGESPIGLRASSELGVRVVETSQGHREVLLGIMSGSPDLLAALGVPILAGRGLAAIDTSTRLTPAVVTASLARMLWRAESPLGHTLSLTGRKGGRFLVVGVAQDFIVGSFNRPAAAAMVTCEHSFGMESQLVVQTPYPPAIDEQIRKVISEVLPDMPPPTISTGRDIIMRDIGRQRLGAWFFSGFGLTALLLGVSGVFGLVAYLAESRQREFGIRVALGATPRNVVWRGVTAALVPVSIGVAAGLAVAAWVSRLFISLLTGLATLDPFTYVAVATIMLGCAACAALGAAWRLRRVAPADALRTV